MTLKQFDTRVALLFDSVKTFKLGQWNSYKESHNEKTSYFGHKKLISVQVHQSICWLQNKPVNLWLLYIKLHCTDSVAGFLVM